MSPSQLSSIFLTSLRPGSSSCSCCVTKPMSPNLAMVRDGKKFMWDGQLYDTREEASRVREAYQNDRFEAQMVGEEGKFLVYTRRVVKEVVVATQ